MSGTTPSRSKAYQVPVRQSPVWASSRISSIPRSAHLSRNAAEVAGRRLDDAAGAEDRLDDGRGQAADRLRVDQVETEVQLTLPVELAVGGSEIGPVAVRAGMAKLPGAAGP